MSGSGSDVLVIGAGPAGLATAGALRMRGIDATVLERASDAGSSWRNHYDRLHLHTVRWLSNLPGLSIPSHEGRYVSRDGVVRYLESYVAHHGLDIRTDVAVERVDRDGAAWHITTSDGDAHARHVVVATGYNHTPFLPNLPGRDTFTGELLHASAYRNGTPYAGKDVLVVGTGNTGAEIAVDLVEHGAARVRLAFRTPPHIMHREMNGIPAQATGVIMRHLPTWLADELAEPVRRMSVPDLSAFGLPDPGKGIYRRAKRGEVPILDVGLIEAVQQRSVEPVRALAGFDGAQVLLADGTAITPDAVIAATGYTRGLDALVGHLGVLGEDGRPLAHGGRTHPAAPGLRFLGYSNPVSGMFREIAIDAKRIAKAIGADLRGAASADAPVPATAGAR